MQDSMKSPTAIAERRFNVDFMQDSMKSTTANRVEQVKTRNVKGENGEKCETGELHPPCLQAKAASHIHIQKRFFPHAS